MNKKWLVLVLVFSVTVNLAAVGTIGYQWWKFRSATSVPLMPHRPMLMPIQRMFSLNPRQMSRLGKQSKQTAEDIAGIRQGLLETRAQLMQLLRAPDPDSTAIDEVIQRLASAQVALERKVVYNILCLREELTPEQLEKLLRMMESRGRWGGMGPEPGPGGRRGPLGPGRGKNRK